VLLRNDFFETANSIIAGPDWLVKVATKGIPSQTPVLCRADLLI
jgi:hypothetical protein